MLASIRFHLTSHWRTKLILQIRRSPNFGAFLFCVMLLISSMGSVVRWRPVTQYGPSISAEIDWLSVISPDFTICKASTSAIVGNMNPAILAALIATVGFACGDVFTALLARKVSGRASMFLLVAMRLLLYVPFIMLWQEEFAKLRVASLLWILLLGVLFTIAYLGFTKALEVGKNPALVGVVAGCFPASASFVAIAFLGQRPTLATITLLITVLAGVILIGLPDEWRTSLKIDKGIALALLPLVFWGVFGALLSKPVGLIGSPHAWFVVQSLVVVVMLFGVLILYNRNIPVFIKNTSRAGAWRFALPAGIIIGLAEAVQALALGSGKQLVIIEAVLGSYPAVYFLIAHKTFHEPLRARQWTGISIVAVSIALLSSGITT